MLFLTVAQTSSHRKLSQHPPHPRNRDRQLNAQITAVFELPTTASDWSTQDVAA